MKTISRLLLPFLAMSALTVAVSTLAAEAIDTKALKDLLKARYPDVVIQQILPSTDLPGFFEIVTPTEIVYTDGRGERLISGTVVDTRTKENLTGKRWAALNAIDFSSLPLDLAIKTVKGNGSRKLAVFADPDCPHCQALEQSMQSITDVTVYTFLYPIDSLHPDARRKSVKIWCASERSQAWNDWMLKQVEPTGAACATTPLDQVSALAEKLRINSTPTLFFANGERFSGEVPTADLERALVSIRAKS